MLERNDNGRLVFKRLDFEIMIADMLEAAKINNMDDLRWAVEQMHGCIEIVAQEHCEGEELGDWEDVFVPAY